MGDDAPEQTPDGSRPRRLFLLLEEVSNPSDPVVQVWYPPQPVKLNPRGTRIVLKRGVYTIAALPWLPEGTLTKITVEGTAE